MPTTLQLNDRHADVRTLRAMLATAGWPLATDDPELFDQELDDVVDEFQGSEVDPRNGRPLGIDGVVGPATWRALDAVEDRNLQAVVDRHAEDFDAEAGRLAAVEALSWLGVRELPNGSNRGPRLDELVEPYRVWAGLDFWPAWCGIAVCQWIRRGLGADSMAETVLGRWLVSVRDDRYPNLEEWARTRDLLYRPEDLVAEIGGVPSGAIFTMGRGGSRSDASSSSRSGHTGLVLWSEATDVLRTIDGNVGNAVDDRRRDFDTVSYVIPWWRAL